MTDHFKPLWAKNVPKFGIGHAMALGVSATSISILLFMLPKTSVRLIEATCYILTATLLKNKYFCNIALYSVSLL
jgi:Ubiquitin-fold modifier-conjugating enzyme 1